MKFEVTLKDLRQAGACYSGYNKVVRTLQGKPFTEEDERRKSYIQHAYKEPISLLFVLESNGLDDAFWALHCVPEIDRDALLLAVWCARKVQHLMKDPRSINALNVAERFARGEATTSELDAAVDAAWAAAVDAAVDAARAAALDAALDAARDAAWAAAGAAARAAAGDAARAAAWDAAWAASWDAARAAAWAAAGDAARAAAGDAARAAAWDAAWAASWDAEAEMFKLMCQGQAPWQTKGD